MADCKITEKYRSIKCSEPAWDDEGFCLLHSRREDKDKEGEFIAAIKAKFNAEDYNFRGVFFPGLFSLMELTGQYEFTFAKPADFSWATFQDRADFRGATFQEEADFFIATFHERGAFSGATFQQADFSIATFQGEANFARATFQGVADFNSANFKGRAFFAMATFQKEANYFRATFQDWANFNATIFQGRANFSGATFKGKGGFYRINDQKELEGPLPPVFSGDFRSLKIDKEAYFFFWDLNLSRVQFTGTDLRHVDFHHVTWPSRGGREAVYDEVLLWRQERAWLSRLLAEVLPGKLWGSLKKLPFLGRLPERVSSSSRLSRLVNRGFLLAALLSSEQTELVPATKPNEGLYFEVERLYRYLKINYEAKGDLKQAGMWHYGEMEMHRRASPWRRGFWFSLYNLYKWLSGYGEQPGLAAFWIPVFLIGLAAILQYAGLDVTAPAPQHRADFWESLVFIFQKVTFQRPAWAEIPTLWGKVLSGFSVLLIPGQAALFLLALRNRLGRRR